MTDDLWFLVCVAIGTPIGLGIAFGGQWLIDRTKTRISHNQQLAYIAGWNAAHEQIRAQLSQLPGVVMTDAEDGEQPRTVH